MSTVKLFHLKSLKEDLHCGQEMKWLDSPNLSKA